MRIGAEKCCENCRYYFYDGSVNASDCNKADDIPEDLFEKHYINGESGCPYHEMIEDIDYYPIEDKTEDIENIGKTFVERS